MPSDKRGTSDVVSVMHDFRQAMLSVANNKLRLVSELNVADLADTISWHDVEPFVRTVLSETNSSPFDRGKTKISLISQALHRDHGKQDEAGLAFVNYGGSGNNDGHTFLISVDFPYNTYRAQQAYDKTLGIILHHESSPHGYQDGKGHCVCGIRESHWVRRFPRVFEISRGSLPKSAWLSSVNDKDQAGRYVIACQAVARCALYRVLLFSLFQKPNLGSLVEEFSLESYFGAKISHMSLTPNPDIYDARATVNFYRTLPFLHKAFRIAAPNQPIRCMKLYDSGQQCDATMLAERYDSWCDFFRSNLRGSDAHSSSQLLDRALKDLSYIDTESVTVSNLYRRIVPYRALLLYKMGNDLHYVDLYAPLYFVGWESRIISVYSGITAYSMNHNFTRWRSWVAIFLAESFLRDLPILATKYQCSDLIQVIALKLMQERRNSCLQDMVRIFPNVAAYFKGNYVVPVYNETDVFSTVRSMLCIAYQADLYALYLLSRVGSGRLSYLDPAIPIDHLQAVADDLSPLVASDLAKEIIGSAHGHLAPLGRERMISALVAYDPVMFKLWKFKKDMVERDKVGGYSIVNLALSFALVNYGILSYLDIYGCHFYAIDRMFWQYLNQSYPGQGCRDYLLSFMSKIATLLSLEEYYKENGGGRPGFREGDSEFFLHLTTFLMHKGIASDDSSSFVTVDFFMSFLRFFYFIKNQYSNPQDISYVPLPPMNSIDATCDAGGLASDAQVCQGSFYDLTELVKEIFSKVDNRQTCIHNIDGADEQRPDMLLSEVVSSPSIASNCFPVLR